MKKINKKKKKKFSLKKWFKGFTLVELLAVIVILAIIMIIAIPNVLNVMEQAKKKSMVNYALKVMKTAEEVYTKNSTFGSISKPATQTYVTYDIQKDLGLSGSNEYYGTVWVKFNAYDNSVNMQLLIGNNDYYVEYYEDVHGNLDISRVRSTSEVTAFATLAQFKDLISKEVYSSVFLKDPCVWDSRAVVDGATNTQMYCTYNHDLNNFHKNDEGKYICDVTFSLNEAQMTALNNYYNNPSALSNCS